MKPCGVSVDVLRTLPVLMGSSSALLCAVGACAKVLHVSRSSVVIDRGMLPRHIYFVLRGSLKSVSANTSGREAVLSLLQAGDMFGEDALFAPATHSARVIANSATDLLAIAATDFQKLLAGDANFSLRVMSCLTLRLRSAERKIETMSLLGVYARVASLLVEMAEMRADGSWLFSLKLSQQEIASMIGASREMVSRAMKDLQSRGLLEDSAQGLVLHTKIAELCES